MMKILMSVILLLITTMAVNAKATHELLREVGENKVKHLIEYNASFLKDRLFVAKQHRIVKVDTAMLLNAADITITPFPGVKPLHFKLKNLKREEDRITWLGLLQREIPLVIGGYDVGFNTHISMNAWDLDKAGNAQLSLLNRQKYSPNKHTEGSIIPMSVYSTSGDSTFRGPEIAAPIANYQYQQSNQLRKHQFYSVSMNFTTDEGKQYILLPLKYTPKYSVILQVDADRISIAQFDHLPGEADTRTEHQKQVALEYKTLLDSLPRQNNKAVKGEL